MRTATIALMGALTLTAVGANTAVEAQGRYAPGIRVSQPLPIRIRPRSWLDAGNVVEANNGSISNPGDQPALHHGQLPEFAALRPKRSLRRCDLARSDHQRPVRGRPFQRDPQHRLLRCRCDRPHLLRLSQRQPLLRVVVGRWTEKGADPTGSAPFSCPDETAVLASAHPRLESRHDGLAHPGGPQRRHARSSNILRAGTRRECIGDGAVE